MNNLDGVIEPPKNHFHRVGESRAQNVTLKYRSHSFIKGIDLRQNLLIIIAPFKMTFIDV